MFAASIGELNLNVPKSVPTSKTNPPAVSAWDAEVRLLIWLTTCVSVMAFLFYAQRSDTMLYGDAVAHINIARRVFDSKTPGLLQLGTVWLPLPHLLMIPGLLSAEMWRRGVGGTIPSLIAYIFGVAGMFRLVRGTLARGADPDGPARIAAWVAALVYAANPNLLYMQTTAMGEALYLAFFIWAIVFFSEYLRGNPRALTKCGVALAASCLTRYDGWFLTAAIVTIAFLREFFFSGGASPRLSRGQVIRFLLIAAAAPVLWLAYNAIVYRNPLEFENGPYSAKAIEQRSQSATNPGHPGSGNLFLAGTYFLKSAEWNMAANQWLQRTWVLFLIAAVGIPLLAARLRWTQGALTELAWLPLLLLLIPVPFYALSVAYGGVPIFVPTWWPFSHYNVRYGLQLLPAFAAVIALLSCLALRVTSWNRRLRLGSVLALLAFAAASYATAWDATPITLKEAQLNMRTRNALEAELATWLERLPSNSTLLMYLGDHVGALQRAGIPLKNVINEGNHRVWKQPSDPEGLWERALADPSKYCDFIVAFEGDPVWQAVHDRHLPEIVQLHISGQARAILYQAR